MKTKPIQITTVIKPDTGELVIIALCKDGSIWGTRDLGDSWFLVKLSNWS